MIRIVERAARPAEGLSMGAATMGEVRARVKLTNAVDEGMARRGQFAAAQVRTCEADALVDAESIRTVIPLGVAKLLGLESRGAFQVEHRDGRRESIGRAAAMLVDWQGRSTVEDPIVRGDEVIIGRTVLMKLDLVVDDAGRRLIPNPAHGDYPVSKV